jgi:tetratricopeptide (TPR) repeat protein
MAARDTADTILIAGTALGTTGALVADCLTTGGAFTAGAALVKGLEFVGGLGQDAVSEKIRERLSIEDLADVHRNHDLERTLRLSVSHVLGLTAKDSGDEALAFLAQSAPVIEDAPTLLVDLFAQTAAHGPQNPLDADGWRTIVLDLERVSKRRAGYERDRHRLGDGAREAAVQALAEGFPAAVRNVVTTNGAADNPAFAKLVLLLLGETLALVRAQSASPAARGLAEPLAEATASFQAALPEAVRAEVRPLADKLDGLADLVSREAGETRREVTESKREILEGQQEMKQEMLEAFAARQVSEAIQSEAVDTTAAPPPVEAFTGRKDVVDEIVARLADEHALNLTGMGGIGKTEVCRAVAEAVEDSAPEWASAGVWYTDLNAAVSADDLLGTILGEWPINVERPTGATVGRALDAPRLYVLDDVEQALAAPGEERAVRTLLRDLLRYAPAARFLVTSRRPVSNVGMKEHEILHLGPDDARTLFGRLADEAGYAYGDGDEARRDSLLADLDGIPLAITLAAGLLTDFEMADVLRRWERRRTAALEALDADDPMRLDSLDVSLGLSVEALPEDGMARSLFALFAALPAGATPDLIEAVYGFEGEDAAVLLRRRGLLRKDGGRYTMRVPVRVYAEVHPTADLTERLRALDDYLLALAWDADERFVEDTARVNRLFTAELPTFDAALARAGPPRVAELTGSLRRWLVYARPPSVAERIERGLKACQHVGDRLGAANCTQSLGDVHMRLGEYGPARGRYGEALAAYVEIGTPLGAANCTKSLGDVHWVLDEYGPARERYEEALAAFVEIGAPLGAATCTQSLGDAHMRLGEYGPARERYGEALAAFVEIGAPLGAANCTQRLGDVHMALGEYGPARGRYGEALAAFVEIGDRLGAANCTKSLGEVHMALGEYGPARERYGEARAAFVEIGSPYGQARVFVEVGKLEVAESRPEQAREAWQEAERLLLGLGLDTHPFLTTLRGWIADLDGG